MRQTGGGKGRQAILSDVTLLLGAVRRGEDGAVDQLCSLLYQDLRQLARARLRPHQRGTMLDTTSLVHESYMRLVKAGEVDVSDRAHFFGYAGRVMRSVIIDFARMKQAERHGGNEIHLTLNTEIASSVAASEDDLIQLNDALDELAKVDERMVKVVELRYFAGLTEQEVATALGVTDRTVRRDWEKARLLLRAALK
jgi:RNA polymerase sigma factor (TIGR02999 family)